MMIAFEWEQRTRSCLAAGLSTILVAGALSLSGTGCATSANTVTDGNAATSAADSSQAARLEAKDKKQIRTKASFVLDCPSEELKLTPMSSGRVRNLKGWWANATTSWGVEGCGHRAVYAVPTNGRVPPYAETIVLESEIHQAAPGPSQQTNVPSGTATQGE